MTTSTPAMYTVRSTISDISNLVPTNLTHVQSAEWARHQARATLRSYGLDLGNGGRIEAEYNDAGEVSAYRVIRNYTHNERGHQAEQELGRVEIVETPLALTFVKSIDYDRITHDYTAKLDGEYIGSYPTQLDAETALDQLEYDLLQSGITATARELDDGSDLEDIAVDRAVSLSRCAACGGEYAGPVCAHCWQPDAPRLTCPQPVALAINGPDSDPAPGPWGPEEDTNWGGWRASENAAGWGTEPLSVSWGS